MKNILQLFRQEEDAKREKWKQEDIEAVKLCRKCSKATAFGKPYCIEHLDNLQYVMDLQLTLDQMDFEASELDSIDINGLLAQEILRLLSLRKVVTLKHLSRETDVTLFVVDKFTQALERAGLIKCIELGSKKGVLRKCAKLIRKKVKIKVKEETNGRQRSAEGASSEAHGRTDGRSGSS